MHQVATRRALIQIPLVEVGLVPVGKLVMPDALMLSFSASFQAELPIIAVDEVAPLLTGAMDPVES